jgi:serine/tyrosine/threonine adenylyltransferase
MSPFAFDNTFARLPERFYARIAPTPVREPRVVKVNDALARLLGLDPEELASSSGARLLSGNELPEGAEPLAAAYAGHQFGGFVPQLGDGRAVLLGEVVGSDGVRRDIQLKGAGRTPFSRGGDGRAALGPVLREYVVSEAMAALGVPTTRALAAVTTGEQVDRGPRLPGAVLTRVATSHLRVGTFQYFAVRRDREALELLTRYALARHYPQSSGAANTALALLEHVVAAQAHLVSRWLGVGFVHGVMNTDNTSISGETIDFGPCAFLDEYHPNKTFSSIDAQGRYAFGNQPTIAQWNLARLAETLLPLIAADEEEAVRLATDRLDRFEEQFATNHDAVLRAKLGLASEDETDQTLIADLMRRLAAHDVDYTIFFRGLCAAAADPAEDAAVASQFGDPSAFLPWLAAWRQRLTREERAPDERARAMRLVNPALIPRNHRIEEAIDAAVKGADFQPFHDLVSALAQPYDERPEFAHLAEPPRPEQRVRQTFCGT